jgi:hypothetical protein
MPVAVGKERVEEWGGPLCVATEKNAKITEVHSITCVLGVKTWLKINGL